MYVQATDGSMGRRLRDLQSAGFDSSSSRPCRTFMTLEADEFIRRLLLHVLPQGLQRTATILISHFLFSKPSALMIAADMG